MIARSSIVVAWLILVTSMSPSTAHATPLLLDNSWVTLDDNSPNQSVPMWFTGTGLGSAVADGATAYTWNSVGAVQLDVTDWLVVGDAFAIFDNGLLVATFSGGPDHPSLPGCVNGLLTAPCHWTNDPNVAWLDPIFNQGTVIFGPGPHSITIAATFIPTGYPDGTVAFRAAPAPVPEPTALVLLGTGLLAVGARLRRRWNA